MTVINEVILKDILLNHFKNPEVVIKDLTGGGDHWSLSIAAREFKGLSLVEQHQLVYRAFGDLMRKEIHALALTTRALD